MPAIALACSIVVGCSLPCQSGMSFGTSISRPSTLILIFSIGGEAGSGSVVVVMLTPSLFIQCSQNFGKPIHIAS